MKDLPKMYHNKIDKDIRNNEKFFSTMYKDKSIEVVKPKKNNLINDKNNYTVEQKIYNIFNSPNYIYKIDVIIETDEGSMSKRIIAKNKKSLITIDNEYIPIDKIRDIYLK